MERVHGPGVHVLYFPPHYNTRYSTKICYEVTSKSLPAHNSKRENKYDIE